LRWTSFVALSAGLKSPLANWNPRMLAYDRTLATMLLRLFKLFLWGHNSATFLQCFPEAVVFRGLAHRNTERYHFCATFYDRSGSFSFLRRQFGEKYDDKKVRNIYGAITSDCANDVPSPPKPTQLLFPDCSSGIGWAKNLFLQHPLNACQTQGHLKKFQKADEEAAPTPNISNSPPGQPAGFLPLGRTTSIWQIPPELFPKSYGFVSNLQVLNKIKIFVNWQQQLLKSAKNICA